MDEWVLVGEFLVDGGGNVRMDGRTRGQHFCTGGAV